MSSTGTWNDEGTWFAFSNSNLISYCGCLPCVCGHQSSGSSTEIIPLKLSLVIAKPCFWTVPPLGPLISTKRKRFLVVSRISAVMLMVTLLRASFTEGRIFKLEIRASYTSRYIGRYGPVEARAGPQSQPQWYCALRRYLARTRVSDHKSSSGSTF